MNYNSLSKFLSLVLRHKPEKIGLKLDKYGYANVSELLEKMNRNGNKIDLNDLKKIVVQDDKQRYSFADDCKKIRANQGHSIEVDLQLYSIVPTCKLYHGTAERFKESIMTEGIKKMNREYVHLSSDLETAKKVGSRHGKCIIFELDIEQMNKDNIEFYLSDNKVWLTNFVDKKYLKIIYI